ncbi:MAG TPA: methyltransferase [Stellaceae bacterium]|nr:methyltransferase [Stellaceae bacterium]
MTHDATQSGFSEDTLLGGRVRLRQPVAGYRVAIDPVLLAASIPAQAGETVLDIGCGSGAAALCLATRVAGVRVTGIERERALVRLANDNAMLNDLGGRVAAMAGDLLRPPPRIEPGTFAHVMANPPYLEPARATAPADPGRAGAKLEGEADLAAWVRFALAMVRAKGTVTFIHRADRLEQLLAQFAGKLGEIVIFPLWPRAARPARRVIVRGRKGAASPTRLMPGLVLHTESGAYTEAADAVLRDGEGLALEAVGEPAPAGQ